MEGLSVFGLVLSVMLLCCGVLSVGKGLLTNHVESVGLGAVSLILGGGMILATNVMDSYVAQANAGQETVVLEDTHMVNKTVATEADPVLTMLFPINTVEIICS